jgi:uncharacterized protein
MADNSALSKPLSPALAGKAQQLEETLRKLGSCIVALSGGVDSAVLAFAASQALGTKALAITASSESVSAVEKESVLKNVAEIRIAHRFEVTREMDSAGYRANAGNRCFFCKQTLYQTLLQIASDEGYRHVLSGVNDDDMDDHRPGIVAAKELGVLLPLADCGITKAEVRELASAWGLSVWDRPSNPCLSSRVAYGLEVTPERLKLVEQAEQVLRDAGFSQFRVRLHPGDLARVEVLPEEMAQLLSAEVSSRVSGKLKELGFAFVTFDLDGLKSGSMNVLVPLDELVVSRNS